ncbi:MAG: dTDP-4-dehydrorhamnose reductase [Pirellulales bacterium]|nr:dTDP-4-dehydrorhamnose reductase [Pirellulales bacterium]
MRVLVTGCGGQLGTSLTKFLDEGESCEVIGVDLPEFDLTDAVAVRKTIREHQPDAVVNTAAYTLVDKAEERRERCAAINEHAITTLVESCNEVDALLCQISTDYVFGSDRARNTPYTEDDVVGPVNFYGQSKAASEQHAHLAKKHLIVRTCGLYGAAGDATKVTNFVDKMIELGSERKQLGVVDDQYCSPSYVPHVARAIAFLVSKGAHGIYHVVNAEPATWREFALEIFRQTGMDVEVEPITTEQFGAPAPRPRYSVLSTTKYQALNGPALPSWREALAEYLDSKTQVSTG